MAAPTTTFDNNTPSQAIRYFVGLKVPNPVNQSLHMTLCYVGECDDDRLIRIKNAMNKLKPHLPIHLKFTEKDLFGPDNDIPVQKVKIVDYGHKIVPTEESFLNFYKEFYVHQDGLPDELKKAPNYHITIKNAGWWVATADGFLGEEIFLKQIGNGIIHAVKDDSN